MLTLVIGPMFSGKTSHVIKMANKFRAIGKKVLIVNHVFDNRYSKTHLVSHDNASEKTMFLENLSILSGLEEYINADVVIIEEAQFFTDLFDFVSIESDKHLLKDFIVSGLSGDFNRNSFGEIYKLVSIAEKVLKLSGFCNVCKDATAGSFTKLLQNNIKSNILVGEKDLYQCVCRKHFLS